MLRRLKSLIARFLPPSQRASPAEPDAPPERTSPAEPDTPPERTSPAEPDAPATAADDIAVVPIEDSIDLHGFQPRDIRSVVEEYLFEAHRRGFVEVRIIHGRGKGVQRRVVQSLLARHKLVVSFRDAPASRGGWGATLVWLKSRR